MTELKVSTQCPGCGSQVTAEQEQVQMPDLCPECNQELPTESLWHDSCLADLEAAIDTGGA